ncbi:hypothetical protein ACLX1H_005173 [Fusarium chlamydosporum]
MPSVNTIITALVAGLAIGAQAGPCRPHPPASSVGQSQVTTTTYAQSTTETSAVYSEVARMSETEASFSTTAVQVASSDENKTNPTATAEKISTTANPVAESTSTSPDSLTTEATVDPTSTVQETTSLLPSTTLHTTTSVPLTTSSEPRTTIAPTTTSQASTTTSEAATSSCLPLSSLTCNVAGFYNNASNKLLGTLQDQDLEQCKAACERNEDCKSIGMTTIGQCELYDSAVSVMEFETEDSSWYSVWD